MIDPVPPCYRYSIIMLERTPDPFGVKCERRGKAALLASFSEEWQAQSFIAREQRTGQARSARHNRTRQAA